MPGAVQILLLMVGAYGVLGAVFAVAFVARGAAAIDPVACHAPERVRVLFAPGAAALWPVLALKWARAERSA